MKPVLFLLLMGMALTSFAQPSQHEGKQIKGRKVSAAGEHKLRFIFISPCMNEAFFNPVKKGMRDAAKLMGVSCDFVGTEDVDIAAQAAMVTKAVADGYDGIAVDIIDATGFDKVVQEALDKGVPVVAFNTDDTTPNPRLSTVSQSLYEAGKNLGEAAAQFITPGAKVMATQHSKGVSALDERLRGLQDALKSKNVKWDLVITGTTPEGAAKVIGQALAADPEISAVLATGQADTEGAGRAAEKLAGRKIFVAGFDLSPELLRLLKAGVIRFTVDQQPYTQGFYPVMQLTLLKRYGIKPSNIDAGATILRPEDAAGAMALSLKGYR